MLAQKRLRRRHAEGAAETTKTTTIGTRASVALSLRCDAAAAAQGMTRADWVRTVLLRALDQRPADEVLLAAIIASRQIVVNAVMDMATTAGMASGGKPFTAEQMRAHIALADQQKYPKAQDALNAART